ncbi:hypothetical protein CLAFUW4_12619 [Fulvia fulva]|uniref:Uncharacterized protein n=1 Tax=Passalora fulva TaxID=5499 RepID=A0A9Q8PF49_PASFU|nr:uncharacterized protein CLAFUR5_11643 [Fulvia fulva]KAK4617499.1 hypothetical protein CLAFUR4_12624 [Fulvia fulva]KAK4618571.1 hypothetical protein CLAFUR0_12635 [Fulvia fulva]UJO21348.1 hypothetical protein CLAFUR5_11643 [Fulvia fulva]WPV17970.1 hypothetical protein CLAFUW4_12619 [Fulvia fulva]WPV33407.1 hypothetical protein CLAFUW7_12626 [Fulvia fulva]
MLGLRTIAISLAAVSSALAVPLENVQQQHKSDAVIQPTDESGDLYRRQFPGLSGADVEIMKDASKAGIWFAEHCAPAIIKANFTGGKPQYDGWKEKFMCPVIAKTFRHLLPFDLPGDLMVPAPF